MSSKLCGVKHVISPLSPSRTVKSPTNSVVATDETLSVASNCFKGKATVVYPCLSAIFSYALFFLDRFFPWLFIRRDGLQMSDFTEIHALIMADARKWKSELNLRVRSNVFRSASLGKGPRELDFYGFLNIDSMVHLTGLRTFAGLRFLKFWALPNPSHSMSLGAASPSILPIPSTRLCEEPSEDGRRSTWKSDEISGLTLQVTLLDATGNKNHAHQPYWPYCLGVGGHT